MTDSTPLPHPFSISAEGRAWRYYTFMGRAAGEKLSAEDPKEKGGRRKEEGEGNNLAFLRNILLATLRSSVNE